ncbi:hypothetical protein [Nonomuraea sp. NPDC049625]|uniref:hypothetical protein n=1 Tax=Nonomuraea sp. NPDC049625 TaxID=3155775 RepID=UPI00343E448F
MGVWLRWERGLRELTGLAPCPVAGDPADDPADDPEKCLLFGGHPSDHSFDRAALIAGIHSEASPEMPARMDALLADHAETP